MPEARLIARIFNASYMQRWNDKISPIEFYELDKQAHKMMIAYFIASFEENHEKIFLDIIEGGLFELLQRIVVTDIKPPIFYRIKNDKENYRKLNEFILDQIEPDLSAVNPDYKEKFNEYFESENNTKAKRILKAAHTYASLWEFKIIERMNPDSFDIKTVRTDLEKTYSQFKDIKGVCELDKNQNYKDFLQLCGELRYQTRWAHTYRVPRTSVLGHSYFVAIVMYILTTNSDFCNKRKFNNFIGALFHDLPETMTRDIISPIKRAIDGVREIIVEYENEQLEKFIYPMLPCVIKDKLKSLLDDEFIAKVRIDNEYVEVSEKELEEKYNKDIYDPYDGEIIKGIDELSAFIEAKTAMNNGCINDEFRKSMDYIYNKYRQKGKIGKIDFLSIFERLKLIL